MALGILRPAIVLPGDWRDWNRAKLDAVLAHERSHIRRFDPAVQLLSAIHRALLWHSPLSWFVHQRIVRVAEEASDDEAIAVTRDRALYAEVLLDFMQRGVRRANWLGVPMARYGRPDERINRILDGTVLSRRVTRWTVAAVLAVGSPLAYVVAAAHPQSAPSALSMSRSGQNRSESPQLAAPSRAQAKAKSAAQSASGVKPDSMSVNLNALGSVMAFYTVTVNPRVDGQLMSVNFKEGDLVHAGQLLASIDPRPYQIQLAQAEGLLDQSQAQLQDAEMALKQGRIPRTQFVTSVVQIEAKIRTDRANVDGAKLQLTYAQVTAPITGIAGLRLVDPGNVVHAADATGIVTISQLQPIAVLFTIPEDRLNKVRARLRDGVSLPVEAWNRDNTVKIATGHVTAVDNQIDLTAGTAKVKAVFDNEDGALFPNQFVNVHLGLGTE